MKGAGMLVVSLSDANFGFWSHLGCSGQNATIFSHKGCAKKYKNIYIFQLILFTPFMQSKFKMVSFEGQKRLGHAQIGHLYRFTSKFPTSIPAPVSCGSPPPLPAVDLRSLQIMAHQLN